MVEYAEPAATQLLHRAFDLLSNRGGPRGFWPLALQFGIGCQLHAVSIRALTQSQSDGHLMEFVICCVCLGHTIVSLRIHLPAKSQTALLKRPYVNVTGPMRCEITNTHSTLLCQTPSPRPFESKSPLVLFTGRTEGVEGCVCCFIRSGVRSAGRKSLRLRMESYQAG